MPLPKPAQDLKIAVLVPCFKRPEYTKKCIESLELSNKVGDTTFYLVDDGSNDKTSEILSNSNLTKCLTINHENQGLRSTIISFFGKAIRCEYDFIAKIDNDCVVPVNWMIDILDIFYRSDADILSPNVNPSNAAISYGKHDDGRGYRLAEIVGGLWFMKLSVIDGIDFEQHNIGGLGGAISLLKQIVTEKDLNIGWAENVVVEDLGHWSGNHPEHIKSDEHFIYSQSVGRQIAWRP